MLNRRKSAFDAAASLLKGDVAAKLRSGLKGVSVDDIAPVISAIEAVLYRQDPSSIEYANLKQARRECQCVRSYLVARAKRKSAGKKAAKKQSPPPTAYVYTNIAEKSWRDVTCYKKPLLGTGYCTPQAIAIATGRAYHKVVEELQILSEEYGSVKSRKIVNGTPIPAWRRYLGKRGWVCVVLNPEGGIGVRYKTFDKMGVMQNLDVGILYQVLGRWHHTMCFKNHVIADHGDYRNGTIRSVWVPNMEDAQRVLRLVKATGHTAWVMPPGCGFYEPVDPYYVAG